MTLGRPLWFTVLGLKWFWEPGGNHWLFLALLLPFVGWLSLSQHMWWQNGLHPQQRGTNKCSAQIFLIWLIFYPSGRGIFALVQLVVSQLTPSWRRRVAQKNTPALIIVREPREGLQQWPGPRQLVLGKVYWDLLTNQVVPLSQAIEDTDRMTVSRGYHCLVSLCV